MSALISIIIPVYKAESYIRRCIDSILSQTYSNFELLLIDDGSPDRCGDLCDGYAKSDSRIKVFHKQNGGPSSARNCGLSEARGQYICFIDSDDWVEECYLEHLLSNANYSKELLIAGYVRETMNKIEKKSFGNCIYKENNFNRLFDAIELYYNGYPWAKLYDKKIIDENHLRFNEEIKFSEDLIFTLSYLLYVESVKTIDYTDYHYMDVNPNSLIRQYHSFETEYSGYRAFFKILNECKNVFCIPEEDLLNTKKWLVYFALRAIKTMYRPGCNWVCAEKRVEILYSSFSHEDKSLFDSLKNYMSFIDKTIFYLIEAGKVNLLDKFLSCFFSLRYCKLLKKLI